MEKLKTNIDILGLIKSALKEVAEMNEIDIPQIDEKTPIYGKRGYLDSVALVHLIVDIEEELSEMGYDITIASEKAFSRNISPFLSVKTLERFIKELAENCKSAK